MAADQQLIDYIKKAKEAGQSDDQTRALLYKNGWTEGEVGEAFSSIKQSQPQVQSQQPQQQAQPVAQPQYQPLQQAQPETQVKIQKPQEQVRPQFQQPREQYQVKPARNGLHLVLKLLVVLILLTVIGGGVYYAITQTGLLDNLITNVSQSSTETPSVPITEKEPVTEPVETQQLQQSIIATSKISSILQDYDVAKITVAAFNKAGEVAYCAVNKTTGKIDCFLNDVKLDNSYSYKPYWVGISPNGNRVVFLYFDSVKKQSFVVENGEEGPRYDGTITSPNFSDDSKSFIFTVIKQDTKNYAVINDKVFLPHDKIYTIPKLSNDGKYLLYGARDGQDLFWVADPVK